MEEKKLTRCFVCIGLSDDAIKEVARVQEVLSGVKFTGKMTELENLHLTLKFLGEVDDLQLEKIKEALRKIDFAEFEAKLGEIGTFNYKGSPKIVWVKIGGKGTFELQEKVDNSLMACKYEKEKRFMSHLTVARLRYVLNKVGFMKYISGIGVKEIKFKVNKFYLMKSELRSPGPVYSVIEEYCCKNN